MRDRTLLISVLVLIVVAALAYLPLINRIGYSHDDWYLMASARAEGAQVFHEIYSVDRPLRAYVLEPAYLLFGQNVLFYNLSAWLFRVLSALLFLWMLRMLWPNRAGWTLSMALLYLLYPGFLSQYNGIDYQAQILSLALAMFSLGLTVYAFFEKRLTIRMIAISLSIISGILYLGLVEYEVGFEFVRVMLLFILAGRVTYNYRERIFNTIKLWLPYSLILLGFGFWRIFFFVGDRKATDIDVQFEQIKLYPFQTLYHWAVQVIQDLYDVIFSAWTIPFSQLVGHIQRWGSIIAVLSVGLIILVIMRLNENQVEDEPSSFRFHNEAILLGLFSAIGGLVPIAMVNREVAFPAFSRYSLTSSVGVSILIVALLMSIKGNVLRNIIVGLLIFISMLTQHGNAVKYVQETDMMKAFWWQVSWRVPQFEKRTTLIANYPVGAAEEDYFVWGPASLIYYPEKQNPQVIQPGLFAAILNKDGVANVLAREPQKLDDRKNIITYKNYRNILVLTQPTLDSCVHILDGNHPEYSRREWDPIRVVGPYSEMEHVLVNETPHTPPTVVFGSEPARGWCYYYEKADLARQQGDWDEVIKLVKEAFEKKLTPKDNIEWMPFLQAYAQLGDPDRLAELAPIVTTDPYIAQQACQILGSMPGLSAAVIEIVDSLYCLE